MSTQLRAVFARLFIYFFLDRFQPSFGLSSPKAECFSGYHSPVIRLTRFFFRILHVHTWIWCPRISVSVWNRHNQCCLQSVLSKVEVGFGESAVEGLGTRSEFCACVYGKFSRRKSPGRYHPSKIQFLQIFYLLSTYFISVSLVSSKSLFFLFQSFVLTFVASHWFSVVFDYSIATSIDLHYFSCCGHLFQFLISRLTSIVIRRFKSIALNVNFI